MGRGLRARLAASTVASGYDTVNVSCFTFTSSSDADVEDSALEYSRRLEAAAKAATLRKVAPHSESWHAVIGFY